MNQLTRYKTRILFWPNHDDPNKLDLVLPNQAGQDYLRTTFLRAAPAVRYETSYWTKATRIQILLAFANDLLLPYRGKVVNTEVAHPISEEGWLNYYIEFPTEEDQLNFLLAWS